MKRMNTLGMVVIGIIGLGLIFYLIKPYWKWIPGYSSVANIICENEARKKTIKCDMVADGSVSLGCLTGLTPAKDICLQRWGL